MRIDHSTVPTREESIVTNLKCRLGRHAWELQRNPEVVGRVAEFDECRRCHKKRDSKGLVDPDQNKTHVVNKFIASEMRFYR